MRRVARKDGAPSITGCRRPSALANLADIVARIFVRDGVSRDNAIPLAGTVVAAERDGSLSHGLLRLPGYVATLKSGWGGRPGCAGGYRFATRRGSRASRPSRSGIRTNPMAFACPRPGHKPRQRARERAVWSTLSPVAARAGSRFLRNARVAGAQFLISVTVPAAMGSSAQLCTTALLPSPRRCNRLSVQSRHSLTRMDGLDGCPLIGRIAGVRARARNGL
jgi:hypothetical protein